MAPAVPDLYVIGAMKSGTTSFYDWYLNVPGINRTKRKEHNGFIRFDDLRDIEQSYRNAFEGTAGLRCDISPKYTQCHEFEGVAEKIHRLNPNARIIYLVRDPIDRLQSHVYHDILRDRLKPRDLESVLEDRSNRYLQTSLYYFQLSPFLKLFPPGQMLVINLNEMKQLNYGLEHRLRDFLGLDDFHLNEGRSYESSGRYKIYFYDKVHESLGNSALTRLYHLFFYLLNIKPVKPLYSMQLLTKIKQHMIEDVNQFAAHTGVDVLSWRTYQSIVV